jgi:hypothetical protein
VGHVAVPSPRRFPPPWTIEELNDACFVVKDSNGQALAYVYFEEAPGRRSAAKLLTKDEGRRFAANVAKLPVLLSTGLADLCPLLREQTSLKTRFPSIPEWLRGRASKGNSL